MKLTELDEVLGPESDETITIEVEKFGGGALEIVWRRPSVGAFAQAIKDVEQLKRKLPLWSEEVLHDLLTVASAHVAPPIEGATVIDFYIMIAKRSDVMWYALQDRFVHEFPHLCRPELLAGRAQMDPTFIERLASGEITGVRVTKKNSTSSASAT
jgi:hypothetical protein